MIRRFFTMTVFVTTVYVAAFGQHIFGREDLIRLGHRFQQEAPAKTQEVWNKTDTILASMSPEAGTETLPSCTFDELQWAQQTYSQTIRL